jgi:hypothetical protein
MRQGWHLIGPVALVCVQFLGQSLQGLAGDDRVPGGSRERFEGLGEFAPLVGEMLMRLGQ